MLYGQSAFKNLNKVEKAFAKLQAKGDQGTSILSLAKQTALADSLVRGFCGIKSQTRFWSYRGKYLNAS
jgi:hypothetical protein